MSGLLVLATIRWARLMVKRNRVQLKSIGRVFDGPHATPKRISEGPFFLNISSLSRGRLDLSRSDHVSEADFEKWTKRVTPQAGDLLFSYETRLGEAALMPDGVRACLGRRMALIRPDRKTVDPAFLLYAYLGPEFQRLIEQNTVHGATVNRIPLVSMPEWEIALPELAEQRAIAKVLGAFDDKIAANVSLANTARSLGMAAFHDAVTNRSRTVTIGEIAAVVTRGVSPRYTEVPGSTLILNQKCVRDQRVSLEPARRTEAGKVKAGRLLQIGDVLVNSTGQGTLGRVARWTYDDEATVDTHITVVRFRSEVTSTVAGFAMLFAESEIETLGEGSTGQTELSREKLSNVRLRLPVGEAGDRLGRQLDQLVELEHAALAENRTLAVTRDTLLPQLISGELRVRDAEAEASEALS